MFLFSPLEFPTWSLFLESSMISHYLFAVHLSDDELKKNEAENHRGRYMEESVRKVPICLIIETDYLGSLFHKEKMGLMHNHGVLRVLCNSTK